MVSTVLTGLLSSERLVLEISWAGSRIGTASSVLSGWWCWCWPVTWTFAVVPCLLLIEAESGPVPPCPSLGCWGPRRPTQPPWPGSGGSFPVVCPRPCCLRILNKIISSARFTSCYIFLARWKRKQLFCWSPCSLSPSTCQSPRWSCERTCRIASLTRSLTCV